jgi:hypothetical protein
MYHNKKCDMHQLTSGIFEPTNGLFGTALRKTGPVKKRIEPILRKAHRPWASAYRRQFLSNGKDSRSMKESAEHRRQFQQNVARRDWRTPGM